MSFWGKIRKKGFRGILKSLSLRISRIWRGGNEWEGDYGSWAEAAAKSTGYDTENILKRVYQATQAVESGSAAYERDSVTFDHIEYSWPLLAGLMWGAAMHKGALRVVDFGGALGSTFRQNRVFFDNLKELRWMVVEQPHFVACGREHFESGDLSFFNSIEECLLAGPADGLILSSVLQYLEQPYDFVHSLGKYEFDYVILDRTPFSTDDEDRIKVQHVPESIYKASYPCHFLSRKDFLGAVTENYRVVEWFVPELEKTLSYQGCILKRIREKSHKSEEAK